MNRHLARAVGVVVASCVALSLTALDDGAVARGAHHRAGAAAPVTTAMAPTAPTAPTAWWLFGDACGAKVRKSSGGYWACTFSDNFNGRALNRSNWLVQTTSASGFHSGPECFVDDPANVSVSGGHLNLTARAAAAPFTCESPSGDYTSNTTSGSVSTWGLFSQAFGRFEIRARFPATTTAGLHSALWLSPQRYKYGAWPLSGEIDIAEYYTRYPDRAIPFIHYSGSALSSTVTNNYCMIADPSAFHTYVAEWTRKAITISFDGKTCVHHKFGLLGTKPFDQPFIVALTQALGVGSNAYARGTTPLPAKTQVDYVHVWS